MLLLLLLLLLGLLQLQHLNRRKAATAQRSTRTWEKYVRRCLPTSPTMALPLPPPQN
jgi:hypothetical protein